MTETTGHPSRLGDDRVVRKGGQVNIHTNVDMPDWMVRSYRRPAIFFEGKKYFLSRKDNSTYRRIRYQLEPWPDDFHDLPGKTIYYDEDYVKARDHALREAKALGRLRYVLLPLTPFLGLLHSSAKLRIEANYGISARSATFQSLWLELFLFFAHGILSMGFTFANLHALASSAGFISMGLLSYLVGMTALLLIDLVVRYGSFLRDEVSPYGFCEWLLKK